VAAGKSSRRKQAYRLLAEYHAGALIGVADTCEQEAAAQLATLAARRSSRRKARDVLRHKIPVWHTDRIQFGPRIDFNLETANYTTRGGFHYFFWFQPLMAQYVDTGRAEYRDGLVDIVKQYYAQRADVAPMVLRRHSVYGRNYAMDPVFSELPVRGKVLMFLPSYAVLCRRGEADAGTTEIFLTLFLGFARSLYRTEKWGYRRGNIQIMGCSTLYRIGAAFLEFRESAKWRRLAEERLTEHARRDFFSDGGHEERTWAYGWHSLEAIVHFYAAATRGGRLGDTRKRFWRRFLRRAFLWFAKTISPTGHTPNYGDGAISSAQNIFNKAAEIFPDLDQKRLQRERATSCILKPSGYAFMRAGEGPDAAYMNINFGPWGGSHTHRDLLDFNIWRHGVPLIEEVVFVTGGRADFFSAWHEAYPPARVHRQILFAKPDYWIVFDMILTYDSPFQASHVLHALRPFTASGPGRYRLKGSPSCLIAFAQPDAIREVKAVSDYAPGTGAASGYLYAEDRYRLSATKWRDFGDSSIIAFATLLLPFKGIRPAPLQGATGDQTRAFEVRHGIRKDVLIFNPPRKAVRYRGHRTEALMSARLDGSWVDASPPR